MNELCLWALPGNGFDELFIQQSPIDNKGLFSCKNLPRHTVLFRTNTGQYSEKELQSGLPVLNNITGEKILGYVNHSCNPISVFTEDGLLINTVYILSGSEILIDYRCFATHQEEPNMNCNCGDKKCIGVITALKVYA